MPGNTLIESKLFYNAEETKKPETVQVDGNIPEWLKGTFLRSGNGLWDLPEAKMSNLLDGYAIIFKFHVNGNSVTFEKKFLESDAYKRAIVAKKPVINEFGTKAFSDTSKSLFSRVVATIIPEISDNNYSTPFLFNSELFMGADSGYYRSLNSKSLKSPEKHDGHKCFGCNGMTAHPLTDANGDLWNIGMSISINALKYHLIKVKCGTESKLPTKDLMKKDSKIICTLPNRRNGYLGNAHSFGMTEKYVIVAEQPYYMVMSRILTSAVKGDTIKDWFEWRPQDKNLFHVIDKETGKILKTEYVSQDSFYYMHFINCYEEDDKIIVDINCYDSPAVLETLEISKLREAQWELEDHPYACRYVLPLVKDVKTLPESTNLISPSNQLPSALRKGNQIVLIPQILSPIKGAELPCMNPSLIGKKYTYYYMAGTYNPSPYSHSVIKFNVQDPKDVKIWKDNDYLYPSEPIFIPNPKASPNEEDDGIVLSSVVDMRKNARDFLLYLDAKTFEEIGRAYFENNIPTGLHGIFLPES